MDEYRDGHVEVMYFTAHNGHELGSTSLPYLPLPISTKENAALKISQGIPPEWIIGGITLIVDYARCMVQISDREEVGDHNNIGSEFMQCVLRKHFITKQDVQKIHSKVKDPETQT